MDRNVVCIEALELCVMFEFLSTFLIFQIFFHSFFSPFLLAPLPLVRSFLPSSAQSFLSLCLLNVYSMVEPLSGSEKPSASREDISFNSALAAGWGMCWGGMKLEEGQEVGGMVLHPG